MSTNYDFIAEEYKRAKLQPWRAHVESFTLLGVIGDLAGKTVVDLACGEGFYSRILREQGAARVTGVDLSEKMIALARQQEAEHPQGIRYVVGDGRNLQLNEEHDLVIAGYLLNYATSREELAAMLNSIARCLKSGGRLVAVNSNPAFDFPSAPSFRKYGFETRVPGEWREGAPFHWIFHLADGPLQIENYYLSVATHEEACRSAGFSSIRWHQLRVSPQGESSCEQGYWTELLSQPPIICLECVK
jgi:ubiquinone/menaquinone biosynthesis C-methylase UbiE